MSHDKPALYLHEELLLLALRDEKGTMQFSASMYPYAIGGAVLSELLLAGCIRIDEGEKPMVELVERRGMDDTVLGDALELVANAKRRKRAADWVSCFAHMKRLRERIAVRLCQRGILRDSEDRILLVFKRRIFPTVDPGPERRILERLRRAIFSGGTGLQPRTALLLALAHATGMLSIHFDKKLLKDRKQRIEQITSGELVGEATRRAVQAAQAAAMAAITAATVATR